MSAGWDISASSTKPPAADPLLSAARPLRATSSPKSTKRLPPVKTKKAKASPFRPSDPHSVMDGLLRSLVLALRAQFPPPVAEKLRQEAELKIRQAGEILD